MTINPNAIKHCMKYIYTGKLARKNLHAIHIFAKDDKIIYEATNAQRLLRIVLPRPDDIPETYNALLSPAKDKFTFPKNTPSAADMVLLGANTYVFTLVNSNEVYRFVDIGEDVDFACVNPLIPKPENLVEFNRYVPINLENHKIISELCEYIMPMASDIESDAPLYVWEGKFEDGVFIALSAPVRKLQGFEKLTREQLGC